MNHANVLQSPSSLDDLKLTQELNVLARTERKLLVDFLLHLAEFDARKLFLRLGHPSLYVYCRDALKLSDGSAFRRYKVARLLKRFPVIAEFLRDSRLTLTRVVLLRNVLTPENHLALLTRAAAGSERDVEVLAASLRPRPEVTDGVRKVSPGKATSTVEVPGSSVSANMPGPTAALALPPLEVPASSVTANTPGPTAALALPPLEVPASSVTANTPGPTVTPALPPVEVPASRASAPGLTAGPALPPVEVRDTRPRRMEVEATSATAFAVRMRVGPEFLAEFDAVRAALSHKIPDGNFEAVLRECFRVTLESCDRRRAAATRRCGTPANEEAAPAPESSSGDLSVPSQARSTSRTTRSRYIPAAVRRAVWKRDEGNCAFVSADGKRCGSQHQLELHHLQAFARGGPSTEENLSLRCRQHNAYEAELEFGPLGTADLEGSREDGTGSREPPTQSTSNARRSENLVRH